MRILYSHRVQAHDGQSVHIEELVKAFRQAGHDIIVVGPSFYDRGSFGGESQLIATLRRHLPRALEELAEILYNFITFRLLLKAYIDQNSNFIYERYNLYHLAGMLMKRWYGVPFYLEVNSPLADERAQFGGLALRRLARRLEKMVWRAADRIFVVTAVLGEIVALSGVPRDRITVVPNGIDRRAFPAKPYQANRGGMVNIGFVGFVREWHGLEEVIAGLAGDNADPPIKLTIVGPRSPAIEVHADRLGVTSLIEFAGLCQRPAIPEVIRTFDIALQPRAVPYASPLKLFEYMACGRAIIAPDQPNIREILTDNENALLFDANEPGALWRAIRRLASDSRLRERLGRAARGTVEGRDYTWQGNAFRVTQAVMADFAKRAAVASAAPPLGRSG